MLLLKNTAIVVFKLTTIRKYIQLCGQIVSMVKSYVVKSVGLKTKTTAEGGTVMQASSPTNKNYVSMYVFQ